MIITIIILRDNNNEKKLIFRPEAEYLNTVTSVIARIKVLKTTIGKKKISVRLKHVYKYSCVGASLNTNIQGHRALRTHEARFFPRNTFHNSLILKSSVALRCRDGKGGIEKKDEREEEEEEEEEKKSVGWRRRKMSGSSD